MACRLAVSSVASEVAEVTSHGGVDDSKLAQISTALLLQGTFLSVASANTLLFATRFRQPCTRSEASMVTLCSGASQVARARSEGNIVCGDQNQARYTTAKQRSMGNSLSRSRSSERCDDACVPEFKRIRGTRWSHVRHGDLDGLEYVCSFAPLCP